MKILITLLFYVHSAPNAVGLNNVLKELESYSGLAYSGEGYLYPFPVECTEILDAFAQSASNLTKCSIQYARPIKLCEKCIYFYTKFTEEYKKLLTTVVNGTTCRSIFISHDRLDPVQEYYDGILSIWNKGNCNDCYNWSEGQPVLSNSTKHINKMFNDTMTCIITNFNPTTNNSNEVCTRCMDSYIQLDKYYKSLSTDGIGIDFVCMDIVDYMNATRSIWSKSLNCCKLRETPEIVFLCCTGIISLLPLFFYLAVRYCGPIRALPNVLRQSRFKQSLIHSMDGRIN